MASDQAARRVFIGLIFLSLLGVALVARPFAQALLLAAALAGAFHGLHRRLTGVLRGRSSLSAAIITVGAVLAVLLPLAALTVYVVAQTLEAIDIIGDVLSREGPRGLLDYVPGPLRSAASKLLERLQAESRGLWTSLQKQLTERGAAAARTVGGAVATTGSLVFQTVMMLIAFYFLLVEGKRLVAWLESVSPLRRGQTHELLAEFRNVSRSVLLSSLATAGVQTLAALMGYLIARVPAPLFFAALTFFVALIPAVGATSACLAAALLLLATGHPWAALFLALWGLVVVGLSDNVIKPLLMKRGLQMHGAIVFFALLGGLAAFGPVGLILGPMTIAFFLAVVRIYERDYGRPTPGPDDPATPPAGTPPAPPQAGSPPAPPQAQAGGPSA